VVMRVRNVKKKRKEDIKSNCSKFRYRLLKIRIGI
jgi:hypothetical protein